MNRSSFLAPVTTICVLLTVFFITASAEQKIKITKLDDLPRHTYKIDVKAVEILDSEPALMKLAGEVKRDLEADLAKYEIEDKTTLKDFYGSLGTIAMLEGNYDAYLNYLGKRKELEDKEPSRLTMGLVTQAYIAAKRAGGDFLKAYRENLKKRLDPLPYSDVEAILKSTKGQFEIMSRTLMAGSIEAGVQPTLDKSGGEMSKDIATGLLSSAYMARTLLPLKEDIVAVYSSVIDQHKEALKPDIWADRDVVLAETEGKAPVVLAVWDSGVDTDIFKNRVWTNSKEVPNNNKDDDKNGFVDDVHGIAYSLHSDKEIPLLFPIGDISKDRPKLQRQLKGLEDIQANIESPEAQELKKTLATLPQDSVKPLWEGIGKYGNYCHGTHVAGIAVKGNPFARVLATRITFDYHMIPELPTIELARKEATAAEECVDYFKKNGVRVVNMSWGNSLQSVESALEANNAGGTPEERKVLAREIFEITRKVLFDAIKNAPDILFVTSAGNANSDVNFEEFYPSSFDLPNVLTVGAVDQAGDETSFTSFGKVDVCANGFEVLSYVPGGDELKLSGTSMSSPNAMNLAGKLLAKKPGLTVAQLRKLIEDGSEERTAGKRTVKLMNPKRSMELLAAMK